MNAYHHGHEAHSVEWAGLKGKKNGELLKAAEGRGYQVLLTVDQGIPRRQTMVTRNLSIVLIRSRTNQMEDLLPLAPAIIKVLEYIQSGEIVLFPFFGLDSLF
jgi:hypothetical protein